MKTKWGGWNRGMKMSPEFNKRVSEGLFERFRKNPVSEETRLKLSESHKGIKNSEEARRKISLALRGNKNGVGNIPWNKGIKMPSEFGEKIRQIRIGKARGQYKPRLTIDGIPRVQGLRTRPLKVRFQVLLRDGFKCKYCGRSKDETILQIDHLFPKSKGGLNKEENYITSCRDCNVGKGDAILSLTI